MIPLNERQLQHHNLDIEDHKGSGITLIVLAVLVGLVVFVFASRARSAEPPLEDAVDTARGLFGVDVDTRNGVRVRAGLLDIQIGGDSRPGSLSDDAEEGAGQRWLFRGTQLINTPVMDTEQREIGRIDDAVLDLRSGQLRYLAVEYPAKFGRDKLFAVPVKRFQIAHKDGAGFYFVVNIEEDVFERAPGFLRGQWPNFGNRRWQDEIDIFYGVYIKPGDVKTRFGTSPDPVRRLSHLERISKISGFTVIGDESEERIGSLADVIIDVGRGRTRYGVVQFDGPVEVADRRFAIPWKELDYEIEDGAACLELEVDYRRMRLAPAFDNSRWPDLLDPRFAERIDSFYADDDD